ncbi:MAG: hypothetical protein HFF13_03080 [Angelakisella sp.]|nr:hypothetical protein [Angelakisella sp.]
MGRTSQFDKLRRSRKRKRFFRRTAAAIAGAALMLACFMTFAVVYQLDLRSALENSLASLKGGGGFPVSLTEVSVQALLPMGGDVAVVTGAGTYIYNGNGALLNSCLSSYRTPQTKTAGGKLLTYDLGGNGLRVDNKAKNLYTTTATGTLLAADIAPTGAIATVQSAPGVYAQVSAYNPRFELMYTWMVQDSYITGVSLSNRGGMMACAGLTMEGQHLVSLLRIHHFDQDEEVARVSLSDQLIVSMVWNDEDEIQVVTNRNLYLFSSEGEQLAMSPLPGELLTYENVPGGIYVAYGDYRDPAGVTVLSYTDDLEQAGSASLDRRLISITSDGNHVLILTEGQLYLGDPALRELKLRSHSDLYMVCPVGSSIYGVSPDGLIHTLL